MKLGARGRRCRKCGADDWMSVAGRSPRCYPCHQKHSRRWLKQERAWQPERVLWRAAASRARRKGIDFTISPDDIVIPERCPVLGLVLDRRAGAGPGPASPTLDRLDSTKGYTPTNVRVISHRANRLKADGTPDEHEAIAAWQRKEMTR